MAKAPVWMVDMSTIVWYWVYEKYDMPIYDPETLEMYVFKTEEDAEKYKTMQQDPKFKHIKCRSGLIGDIVRRYELDKFISIVPDEWIK